MMYHLYIKNNLPYCLQVFTLYVISLHILKLNVALHCVLELKEVSLNVKGTGNFLLGHYPFFSKKNIFFVLHSVSQFVGNRKHKPTTAVVCVFPIIAASLF